MYLYFIIVFLLWLVPIWITAIRLNPTKDFSTPEQMVTLHRVTLHRVITSGTTTEILFFFSFDHSFHMDSLFFLFYGRVLPRPVHHFERTYVPSRTFVIYILPKKNYCTIYYVCT